MTRDRVNNRFNREDHSNYHFSNISPLSEYDVERRRRKRRRSAVGGKPMLRTMILRQ